MKTFKYTLEGKQLTICLNEKQGTIAEILYDGQAPKLSDEDMAAYAAAISLALIEHEVEIVHDDESGIITVAPHHSEWNNPVNLMTQH